MATFGLESPPTTFGGAAALNYSPLPSLPLLALRAGASLRAGGLSGGSTLTFAPSAGVAWRFLPSREGRALGASARLDYLVVDQQVTQVSSGGSSTLNVWVSGMGATVDAELRVSAGADLVLGVGFEELFSPTYVYVDGVALANLPATRLTAEAGVRLGL
jgi:hypothetical protein